MILLKLVELVSEFLATEISKSSPKEVINTNFWVCVDQDGDVLQGKVQDITIKERHGKHIIYFNIPSS